jgi:hypothetical protein
MLAWTDGFARLAAPLGLLDGDRPNFLWYAFVDPRARECMPDWDAFVSGVVSALQSDLHPDDAAAGALVRALTEAAGPTFTALWERPSVARTGSGQRRFSHPEVGPLTVSYEAMGLPDAERQWLMVYLPADDATSAAFDRLAGRQPGSLRSVSAS